MKIEKINFNNTTLDSSTIQNILSSQKLTELEKVKFLQNNRMQIRQVFENETITGTEFKEMMKNRPIIKFRPLKNSFTKRGDKVLLAKTLNIDTASVDDYIRNTTEDLKKTKDLDFLPKETVKAIQTYVYRHGTKEQVVVFLDNELKQAKDVLKTLYTTLNYNEGGLADYFVRPIHRMSNNTFYKIYDVINKNLDIAQKSGSISQENKENTAKWALFQVYQIQQNSKLINAVKTYKVLK